MPKPLRRATLKCQIGGLPKGTKGLVDILDYPPHEFTPVDKDGHSHGCVWYTVNLRDVELEEEVTRA